MMYLASALTYYEGEAILGVFSTRQKAKDAINRDKREHSPDEFVIYEMTLNEDTIHYNNIVWSNREETK